MKINNFRGELTDISVKKEALYGTLVSGDVNDSTDSQVVLGVSNVHVDQCFLFQN